MGTRRGKALFAGATALAGVIAVGGMALANSRESRLKAELSGQNEVPPRDPDGDGRARVQFHVDGDELCFTIRFDDTGTPNRGHIHLGGVGANGGIEVTLFELVGLPDDPRNDELESGKIEDCIVPEDPTDLAKIAENPEGYYVNLHNTRYPGGAIRGQLED